MEQSDRRRILAVVMMVGGLVGAVWGFHVVQYAGTTAAHDTTVRVYEPTPPINGTIDEYGSLNPRGQRLFEQALTETHVPLRLGENEAVIESTRAAKVNNSTLFTRSETSYIRHEGTLYAVAFDDGIRDQDPLLFTVAIPVLFLVLIVGPLFIAGRGGRIYREHTHGTEF